MFLVPWLPPALALLAAPPSGAGASDFVKKALAREVIGPRQTMHDLLAHAEGRIPRLPVFTSKEEWEKYATRLRADVLTRVVFRGAAARWRTARLGSVWLETLPGGAGYNLRRVRYEAVPGLW